MKRLNLPCVLTVPEVAFVVTWSSRSVQLGSSVLYGRGRTLVLVWWSNKFDWLELTRLWLCDDGVYSVNSCLMLVHTESCSSFPGNEASRSIIVTAECRIVTIYLAF